MINISIIALLYVWPVIIHVQHALVDQVQVTVQLAILYQIELQ